MNMATEELAERVRALLPADENIREKRMFGGICFMLDGNMLVAPGGDGSMMVRVGKDGMAAALRRTGATPMEMSGRKMGGFVLVSGDALEDESALGEWIDLARAFVKTLPAK